MPFYCVTYGGGIHLIDLMRWMMGEEIAEVSGMGNKLASRGADFPYPDTIVNLLRFEGGALAKTLTTFAPQRPQIHALSIYGSRGTFVNDMPDGKLFSGSQPGDEAPMTVPYPAIEKGALLPDFIAAIREGREPNVGRRDIFRIMDVCFAAWESVQAQRTVKVSYLI
jgi:predicted dehydrogenase